MIDRRRLSAPRTDGGVLIDPAIDELAAAAQRRAPAVDAVPLLDGDVGTLRQELLDELDLRGPVVLTGHQAEFFHAGVFAKTVVSHALAERVGGCAVFLTVDSDVGRTDRLIVPQVTTGGLRRVEVVVPSADPALPAEAQPAAPRRHWLEFFTRVASLMQGYEQSLLRPFADGWLAASDDQPIGFCDAMARGRAATERALGLAGVRELRVSRLATTRAFRAFAAHVMLDARRFADAYNAAQAAYRQRHHVRAASRPVPPLAVAERVELPFWIARLGEPRRRLSVVQRPECVALFADEQAVGCIPADRLGSVEWHAEPWPCEREGWLLRPRALALTAFARLLLADAFLHGVGGALYDEMTEEFVERFLGIQPRPAGCVTATLHLPLPAPSASRGDVLAARRAARDVRFNPQRYVQGAPAELLGRRDELIGEAVRLRSQASADSVRRRMLFHEIRRANGQLLNHDPWRGAELDRRVRVLEAARRVAAMAQDREYFYALHSVDAMRRLADTLRGQTNVR